MRRVASLVGLALPLVLGVTHAVAQSDAKPEAARLFEEGRKLLADGKPDEACAKFEASLLKDPRAVGTLLNLGLCNERSGKVASALKLFREAYDRASEADQKEQRQAAQEHIATLTAQVPTVALAIAGPPAPDTKLLIDDDVVPLDTDELPIDPGRHEIVMTAPGRLPYQSTFTIAVAGHLELTLPVLELPQEKVVVTGSRKTYGKVALWSGVGLVVAASAVAGYAWLSYDKLFDDGDCDANRVCNAHGVEVADCSQLLGSVATVVGGIGVAASITGAILVFTAPREGQRIIPTGSTNEVGFAITGRF